MPEPDFLPTSILAPLLRTYGNIPAPVIYPPGSDPRSFSNPNLHRHQVLETTMDVDPCVFGSRREIDSKTADLTASEHAGVTLSEATTMVSTTSNHPTNSTVVATQTVNDVLITKTETKNTNFIVCNVICEDEKVFKKHAHLKNAQKPTLSSTMNQETPSPVANGNVDQESQEKNQDLEVIQKLIISTTVKPETPSSVAKDTLSDKKNQDLLQAEAAAESLFVCAIPEPGVDYHKIATVEVDESWFKNRVPKPTSRTPVGMSPLQASKQDCKTRWCEICKVSCSLVDYEGHVSGKKHAKNLRKLPNLPSTVAGSVTTPLAEKLQLTKGEVVNPNEGNSLRCELCGVDCNSPYVFNKHILGKKHQKKLKNNSENQLVPSPAPVAETPLPEPMDEEDEVVILESNKRKANDTLVSEEDADTKKQKLNDVLLTCKMCNVGCYGFMAFNTHLLGYEHLAMALEQAKGGSSGL